MSFIQLWTPSSIYLVKYGFTTGDPEPYCRADDFKSQKNVPQMSSPPHPLFVNILVPVRSPYDRSPEIISAIIFRAHDASHFICRSRLYK